MQIIQRIFRFLTHKAALLIVGNAIVLGVPLAALSIHFTNVDTVTGWLSDSNSYETLLTEGVNLVEQTAGESNNQTIGESITDNPLIDDQAITAIIAQSIDANDLQTQTEQALNSTYAWLDGTINVVEFEISISPNTDTLRSNLTQELSSQLSSLPTCTPDQVAANTNIISAVCLPEGETVDGEVEEYIAGVLNSDGFLGDANLSAEDLNLDEVDTEQVQSGFSLLQNIPFISLAALLIAAPTAALTSKHGGLQGIQGLGFAIASPSFFMGIASFFTQRLENIPTSLLGLGSVNSSQADAARAIIEPLSLMIVGDVSSTIFNSALPLFVLGLILIIVSWRVRQDNGPTSPGSKTMLSDDEPLDPGMWDESKAKK